MNKENSLTLQKEDLKSKHLVMSLILDLIGMMTYLVPWFGELADFAWAPISGMILIKMYKGNTGKIAGIIGFIEEIIPGLDFIPTFTITWFYTYMIQGKNNP